MPITTDYDTFATRYHGSIVDTPDARSPDEFFDALDEFFGTDDGYTHHLSRIYAMKDKIASLQASEAKLEAENEKLKAENKETMAENEKLRVDLNEYCSVKTLAASVVFWKEENDKLTEENEKLKEDLDHMGIERADNTSEIDGLKEGWKVLNDFFTTEDFDGQAIVSYVSPFMMMEDENEKLKAETDRLGKWKIYYEDLVGFGRIEKYEEKRKEYDPDFVPHSD